MFGQDRDQIRAMYVEAWRKFQAREPLTALEGQIAAIVQAHPEYHALLDNREKALGQDFLPEFGQSNPFLHMGMHLAIREQVDTDRPAGVRRVHETLSKKLGDPLEAEHQMMEVLAEMLWTAQRDNQPPNEQAYLRGLKTLI